MTEPLHLMSHRQRLAHEIAALEAKDELTAFDRATLSMYREMLGVLISRPDTETGEHRP